MYPINSTVSVRSVSYGIWSLWKGRGSKLTVSSKHHRDEEPCPRSEQVVGMQAGHYSVEDDEDDRRRHGGVVEVGLPVVETAGHRCEQ